MRRRHLLGIGLFALPILAILLLVLSRDRADSADSVNASSIARLQLGMTGKEVDLVLGRPADSAGTIDRDENGEVKKYLAKQWIGPVRDVRVAFDDAGKTSTIVEGVSPPRGVVNRLRAWVGF